MSLPICIDTAGATALTGIAAYKAVKLDGNGRIVVTAATTDVPLGITLEACEADEAPPIAAPGQEITILGSFSGLTLGAQLAGTAAGAFSDVTGTDTSTVTPATPIWVVASISRVIGAYSARVITSRNPIHGSTDT